MDFTVRAGAWPMGGHDTNAIVLAAGAGTENPTLYRMSMSTDAVTRFGRKASGWDVGKTAVGNIRYHGAAEAVPGGGCFVRAGASV